MSHLTLSGLNLPISSFLFATSKCFSNKVVFFLQNIKKVIWKTRIGLKYPSLVDFDYFLVYSLGNMHHLVSFQALVHSSTPGGSEGEGDSVRGREGRRESEEWGCNPDKVLETI